METGSLGTHRLSEDDDLHLVGADVSENVRGEDGEKHRGEGKLGKLRGHRS